MRTRTAVKRLSVLLLALLNLICLFSCGGRSGGEQSIEQSDEQSAEQSAGQSVGQSAEQSGGQSAAPDESVAGSGEEARDHSGASPVGSTCTPALFRAEGSGGGVLYLFGSIHAGDERMRDMPDYVLDAYEESDYICVEADIVAFEKDIAGQVGCAKMLLCKGGTKIADHIGDGLYRKTRAFLKGQGLYMKAYDNYCPAFWGLLLDQAVLGMTKLSAENGADMFFLKRAHKEGKEVREAESVRFQYEVLSGFSDGLYRYLIENTVDNAADSAKELEETYEAWLRGDETELREMMDEAPEESTDGEELRLYEEYNKALLTDRNLGMAEIAERYLAEGKTGLFIVGEAHILCKGGLVDMLRERGYTVEQVWGTSPCESAALCLFGGALAKQAELPAKWAAFLQNSRSFPKNRQRFCKTGGAPCKTAGASCKAAGALAKQAKMSFKCA